MLWPGLWRWKSSFTFWSRCWLAIFAIADTRIRRSVIVILMLASAVLGGQFLHTRLQTSVLYYLPLFLAGFLLCDLYVTRRDWKASWAWDLAALCGWPLVWYLSPAWSHILLPFIIVVLYLAAFRGRLCSKLFSNPMITDIGGMCYSLYLFHFLSSRRSAAYQSQYTSGIISGLTTCCKLSGASSRSDSLRGFLLLVERPCMDQRLAPKAVEPFVCPPTYSRRWHDSEGIRRPSRMFP